MQQERMCLTTSSNIILAHSLAALAALGKPKVQPGRLAVAVAAAGDDNAR